MLRENCSYGNAIETWKKPKSKDITELNVSI